MLSRAASTSRGGKTSDDLAGTLFPDDACRNMMSESLTNSIHSNRQGKFRHSGANMIEVENENQSWWIC
jgi:hypothetical protein